MSRAKCIYNCSTTVNANKMKHSIKKASCLIFHVQKSDKMGHKNFKARQENRQHVNTKTTKAMYKTDLLILTSMPLLFYFFLCAQHPSKIRLMIVDFLVHKTSVLLLLLD